MKRALVLLLALAISVLAAGQARAANAVSAKAVAKSPSEVAAYWTAERMRKAKPVARVKGNGNKPRASYPFSRYQAPKPYDARHGKVFFTERGVKYVCSGTALNSGNKSVVWTAGHCVNEGPGAYVTNWAFVPGYDNGARPYGTFAATSLYTTNQWRTAGDFSYDLGAAKVAPVSGRTLNATVGGRGVSFNYTATVGSTHFLSFGYPAASPFNGSALYICDANLGTRDTSANPPTMGIGCDMTGGSSGGGWVDNNGNVASVNSYGYQMLKNVMFGPYQGTVAQSLYTTAAAG
jgi:V8-like Glu-specific endopeptidase